MFGYSHPLADVRGHVETGALVAALYQRRQCVQGRVWPCGQHLHAGCMTLAVLDERRLRLWRDAPLAYRSFGHDGCTLALADQFGLNHGWHPPDLCEGQLGSDGM